MLVLSKFHDYYDAVLKQGIDKTLVYKRDTQDFIFTSNLYKSWEPSSSPELCELAEEMKYELPMVRGRDWGRNTDESFEAYPFLIGFCGKIHIGYLLKTTSWTGLNHSYFNEIVWDTDGIIAFMGKHKLENSLDSFTQSEKLSKTYRRWNFGVGKYTKFHMSTMDDVFKKFDGHPVLSQFFVKYHTPVYKITLDTHAIQFTLTINPELKHLNFITKVDPYTAFQEISMYLGGVLGVGTPEVVTVSDKTKAIKHGMDSTSFRTPSPGKKFNRRSK